MAGIIDLAEALVVIEEPEERRPGRAGIVSFLDIPSGDVFDVPPDRAIAYFSRKGLRETYSYADLIGSEHDRAFTIAKMMDVDLLRQVKDSLTSAKANGVAFEEWARDLGPMLQRAGWWGKVDGDQLGSRWRLETIYRTNMQASYSAGQWEEIREQAAVAPFLLYDAIDDDVTRPSHRARDGTCLPITHPWWRENTPPLAYRCRCSVIQLSRFDLEQMGIPVSDIPPDIPQRVWKNPRTGAETTLPGGVDPGFGRIPGGPIVRTGSNSVALVSAGEETEALGMLEEKIKALDAPMEAAARAGSTPEIRAAAVSASLTSAAAGVRSRTLAGAAVREVEKARRDEAKQADAQAEIDAIEVSSDTPEAAALRELRQSPEWLALLAVERLRALRVRAREIARK